MGETKRKGDRGKKNRGGGEGGAGDKGRERGDGRNVNKLHSVQGHSHVEWGGGG